MKILRKFTKNSNIEFNIDEPNVTESWRVDSAYRFPRHFLELSFRKKLSTSHKIDPTRQSGARMTFPGHGRKQKYNKDAHPLSAPSRTITKPEAGKRTRCTAVNGGLRPRRAATRPSPKWRALARPRGARSMRPAPQTPTENWGQSRSGRGRSARARVATPPPYPHTTVWMARGRHFGDGGFHDRGEGRRIWRQIEIFLMSFQRCVKYKVM